MGYLIFRGHSTSEMTNVYVSQMPNHKKAAMRFSEYYVKGRDGALHVDEGFENFDMQTVLVLVNAGAEQRYVVNAWADGTGKLISSDDVTRAYKASVKSDVVWQRVKAQTAVETFSTTKSYVVGDIVLKDGIIYKFTANHTGTWSSSYVTTIPVPNGFFDTATITFNCQPYMYESVDSEQTLNQTTKLVNPGTANALPMIKVYGSGDADFTFNGSHIYIDGMTSGVPVNIDCETGYVYTPTGATSIRGEIPELSIEPATGAESVNVVTFGSNVTSIVVTPHWRWV